MKIKRETVEFKEKLRERLWIIECIELKNYHCLSTAKYRGLIADPRLSSFRSD